MNIFNALNPIEAKLNAPATHYLYLCAHRVDVTPIQTVEAIYSFDNGLNNLVELMCLIQNYPNFQNIPKMRELYHVGRIKLDETSHLSPAQYSITHIYKRTLDDDMASSKRLNDERVVQDDSSDESLYSQCEQEYQASLLPSFPEVKLDERVVDFSQFEELYQKARIQADRNDDAGQSLFAQLDARHVQCTSGTKRSLK